MQGGRTLLRGVQKRRILWIAALPLESTAA